MFLWRLYFLARLTSFSDSNGVLNIFRTCGPEMVKSGCEQDKSDPKKAHCWCDTAMCNSHIMLNVTAYAKVESSSTESSTSDGNDDTKSASTKHNIYIIFEVIMGFMVFVFEV